MSYGDNEVFVKCDAREQLPIFTAEADQLALLARSKSVRVPEVYGVGSDRDYSFLLLEYQQLKPLDAHGAYCLGQQLAHLHQWSEQPQFGLDFDSDLTTTPQPNAWQRRWSEFFAEQRIGWQLQLAAEKGMTFGDIDDIVDRVYLRLQHHQPQPSLLHGNLWPGNCAMTAHGPILFDPASYWGDRECDLAMLPLYPELPPQIYDGYQSVWPLGPDLSSASRCISCTTCSTAATCSVASIWWRRNARWRRCCSPRRHNVPGRRSAPHSWFRPRRPAAPTGGSRTRRSPQSRSAGYTAGSTAGRWCGAAA